MRTVDIEQAKASFYRLLRDLEDGREDEIILTRHGRPVAKLIPARRVMPGIRFGALKGAIKVSDDFDAPDAEVEKLFYRGDST